MRRTDHPGRRRGFTLIEAIATIAILGVVTSGISMMMMSAIEGFMDGSTGAQVHAEMSVSLDRAAREIRRIEQDAGASGVAPNITSVTANALEWEDAAGDNYTLALKGDAVLLRVDGGTPQKLLTDVTGFVVQCYDEDNKALSTTLSGTACDPIRRVRLIVTVTRDGVQQTLRSKVFIRSTMAGAEPVS